MKNSEVLLELKDLGRIIKSSFEEITSLHAKAIESPAPSPTPISPKYEAPAPITPFTPVPAPKSDPVK